VTIPRGYRLRPVEAVQIWTEAAGITSGPLFRAVKLGGKVSDGPLADNSAAQIVKRCARRVGLDPRPMPATALRSGFRGVVPVMRVTTAGERCRTHPTSWQHMHRIDIGNARTCLTLSLTLGV
jgi:hypothetical protein